MVVPKLSFPDVIAFVLSSANFFCWSVERLIPYHDENIVYSVFLFSF